MKTDPNCGAMGAGAGGGNRVAKSHISTQHASADTLTMMGKPKSSGNWMTSRDKPKGQPSNAGNPLSGAKPKRSFSKIQD